MGTPLTATPTIQQSYGREATGTFTLVANPNNNLPDGLSLDPSTGVISGTPLAPQQSTGVVIQFEGTGNDNFYGTRIATWNIEINDPSER